MNTTLAPVLLRFVPLANKPDLTSLRRKNHCKLIPRRPAACRATGRRTRTERDFLNVTANAVGDGD